MMINRRIPHEDRSPWAPCATVFFPVPTLYADMVRHLAQRYRAWAFIGEFVARVTP